MPEHTHHHEREKCPSCPTCDRAFREVTDHPLIYIFGCERVALPDIIPSKKDETFYDEKDMNWSRRSSCRFPQEIHSLLNKPDAPESVRDNGKVYTKVASQYREAFDLTDIVYEAVMHPQIQDSLATLQSWIEQEIESQEIKELPGFKYSHTVGEYKGLKLVLSSASHHTSGTSFCSINFIGTRYWGPKVIDEKVAQLHYEGRLRQAQPSQTLQPH